jgi:hypothetical protein
MCIGLAVIALGALDAPVAAQLQGKTCLNYATGAKSSDPVFLAASNLGMSVTWTTVDPESWFIDKLQSQSWDLVGINYNLQFQQKQLIADLLEAHVAGGGKLIVNYPQLDEWPEVWGLLGVTPVGDRDKPADVRALSPGNVIWATGDGISKLEDAWPDNGDNLSLAQGSGFVVVFKGPGSLIAAAVNSDRSVFTNSFEWDSMISSSSFFHCTRQIEYLFSCKADLTGDGKLDIFDYLEFVNLFNAKDRRANVNFDGSLDLFDFLEFINLFNQGC